ncbi:hypothetical protein DV736_g2309, partial [Chaetothyriales sp. CBS 134916]
MVAVKRTSSVSFRRIEDDESNGNESSQPIPMSLRPRSLSHHLSQTNVPSRAWLQLQAHFWRAGMALGMLFHGWASPHAPAPAFSHSIATDSEPIGLLFYLPPNYHQTVLGDPLYRFPVVVNFHGGGFCLGDARDDRYWARVVTQRTGAVFVSVNYRRAPEAAFPKPVDDCVEALLHLSAHASDLHIDPLNVALTGFSAGANLAFSVPLRLRYCKKINALQRPPDSPLISQDRSRDLPPPKFSDHDGRSTLRPAFNRSSSSMLLHLRTGTPLRIRSIVAWYPLLDWTKSRAQKKRESINPQKVLGQTLTDLFDFSYLPPPDREGLHCSPYASPGLAPDHMLANGLPQDMQIWLCEWDMLLREGQVFAARLERLGKNIDAIVVPRVPHGWDKSPNPFRDQPAIDILYDKAARGLAEVFSQDDGLHTRASSIAEGIIGRQPRRSIVLPV